MLQRKRRLRSRISKIAGIMALGAACLLVMLALGGLSYRGYRQYDAAKSLAVRSPKGIEESRFVMIGGIEQWIQMRGQDSENPVLLILHGGPGASYVPLTSIFLPWEKYFTLVQWDQRGTGRTYGRNGARGSGSLTLDRMVDDGIEVAAYVRERLKKPRILLF